MEADAPALVVEGACTECGAPWVAGIFDHSVQCEFCGSLLVAARERNDEVFVVTHGKGTPDVLEVLIRSELDELRSSLIGRFRLEEGLSLEARAWVEARVAARRAELAAELELRECLDFFAPYELHEQRIFQGILGRRNEVKESFLQAFTAEELVRRYDARRFNLRDRGLKIRGFRLKLLEAEHLELAENRFLDVVEAQPQGLDLDRSKLRLRPGTRVISRIAEVWKDRRIRVYKHMTYVRVARRRGREQHLLLDRQFNGIAGRLEPAEVEAFRAIPAQPVERMLRKPAIGMIAAECPNCGWALRLPPRERIVFCPTCYSAVRAEPDGLSRSAYRAGRPPLDAERVIWVPFWGFRFDVTAGGTRYRRIWDWLAAVSPQPAAELFRATDPEQSTFYLPAREVWGMPELDDVLAQLLGFVNWAQPELSPDRPVPDERARLLGVDVAADDARALARFALLALHDVQSTRRLNGQRFRSLIADAELRLGSPFLASIPLGFRGGSWAPAQATYGSTARGFELHWLERDWSRQCIRRAFNLV